MYTRNTFMHTTSARSPAGINIRQLVKHVLLFAENMYDRPIMEIIREFNDEFNARIVTLKPSNKSVMKDILLES